MPQLFHACLSEWFPSTVASMISPCETLWIHYPTLWSLDILFGFSHILETIPSASTTWWRLGFPSLLYLSATTAHWNWKITVLGWPNCKRRRATACLVQVNCRKVLQKSIRRDLGTLSWAEVCEGGSHWGINCWNVYWKKEELSTIVRRGWIRPLLWRRSTWGCIAKDVDSFRLPQWTKQILTGWRWVRRQHVIESVMGFEISGWLQRSDCQTDRLGQVQQLVENLWWRAGQDHTWYLGHMSASLLMLLGTVNLRETNSVRPFLLYPQHSSNLYIFCFAVLNLVSLLRLSLLVYSDP